MSERTEIDSTGVAKVAALIESVKEAGLIEAAEMFSTVYWAWLRITSAYVHGHPYVGHPEFKHHPKGALHVVDYTFNHWGPLIPGTPRIDDKAVLDDAAADEAWHRKSGLSLRTTVGKASDHPMECSRRRNSQSNTLRRSANGRRKSTATL